MFRYQRVKQNGVIITPPAGLKIIFAFLNLLLFFLSLWGAAANYLIDWFFFFHFARVTTRLSKIKTRHPYIEYNQTHLAQKIYFYNQLVHSVLVVKKG